MWLMLAHWMLQHNLRRQFTTVINTSVTNEGSDTSIYYKLYGDHKEAKCCGRHFCIHIHLNCCHLTYARIHNHVHIRLCGYHPSPHLHQWWLVGGDIGGRAYCNGWIGMNGTVSNASEKWFPSVWYHFINSIQAVTMSLSTSFICPTLTMSFNCHDFTMGLQSSIPSDINVLKS